MQANPASLTRSRAELLLPTLMELKSWVRQLGQQLRTEHSTATLATLAVIEREGPARISDLAETARVDTSVVSRIAKTLEGAGLVERSSDPDDGRAHRLGLSAAGLEVLEAGRREMADHMAARLDGWTDEELEQLNTTLRRLLRDLGRPPATADRATQTTTTTDERDRISCPANSGTTPPATAPRPPPPSPLPPSLRSSRAPTARPR